jgi:uncharacterized membrane protein YbhN (UPF0104 family)
MTKLLTVVGARPQFIKAATVSRGIRSSTGAGILEVLVHTGQHYDNKMSSYLKILASLVLLIVVLNSSFFSMLWRGFDIRFLWALLAVQPLLLLGLVVHSMRHIVLIGEPRVPLVMAIKAMALSQGLSLLLPGRISELLKGTYLRDHGGVPLSVGISAVILERTIDLLIVAALGFFGLAMSTDAIDYKTVQFFGLASIIILLVALFARDLMLRMIRALPWLRLANFTEHTYLHFAATVRTAVFFKAFLLGIIAWCISYANIFAFLQIASNVPIGFSGALLVLVFTTIGGAVPLLPGGLGTYELAAVAALGMLGFEVDKAIPIALALHASQLILMFVLALILMLTERIGLSSLIAELRASGAVPFILRGSDDHKNVK